SRLHRLVEHRRQSYEPVAGTVARSPSRRSREVSTFIDPRLHSTPEFSFMRRTNRSCVDMAEEIEALWRRRQVQAVTGLATSSLYREIAEGRFPSPVRIGTRAV